jgi:hypothetical protein
VKSYAGFKGEVFNFVFPTLGIELFDKIVVHSKNVLEIIVIFWKLRLSSAVIPRLTSDPANEFFG